MNRCVIAFAAALLAVTSAVSAFAQTAPAAGQPHSHHDSKATPAPSAGATSEHAQHGNAPQGGPAAADTSAAPSAQSHHGAAGAGASGGSGPSHMSGGGMMCPMMMAHSAGQGMGASSDPKAQARMLRMRGEMMKAMGDVMLKHAQALEEGK
jgi:hypothetical protein